MLITLLKVTLILVKYLYKGIVKVTLRRSAQALEDLRKVTLIGSRIKTREVGG